MDKRRILLIDDEEGFTTVLKFNLVKEGMEVAAENDPKKALGVAREFLPDIIFLDMVMPDVDGPDLKSQLRSDPTTKDIPIIFLTALVSHDDVSNDAALIESGEDLLIPKPVKLEVVLKCIKEHCE